MIRTQEVSDFSDTTENAANQTLILEKRCLSACNISAIPSSVTQNFSKCQSQVITCDDECNFSCKIINGLQFDSGAEGVLFTIGNCISMAALLFTFVTYVSIPKLRSSKIGRYLLNLVAALFIAKMAFQINPSFSSIPHFCSTLAILQHYFCLSAFLWTNIMTVDLYREVTSAPANRGPKSSPFLLYTCYAWGMPLPVVIACLVVETMQDFEFHYGNQEHCGVLGDDTLVYSLAIPLVLITLANIVFFLLIALRPEIKSRLLRRKKKDSEEVVLYERSPSVMSETTPSELRSTLAAKYGTTNLAMDAEASAESIHQTRTVNPGCLQTDTMPPNQRSSIVTNGLTPAHSTHDLLREHDNQYDQQANTLWVYSKMSILMSFAWLSGFIAILTQTFQLWLIFVILNMMQGVFICFSFTLNPPASVILMMRWKKLKQRVRRRAKYRQFGERYNQNAHNVANDNAESQANSAVIEIPSVAELTV